MKSKYTEYAGISLGRSDDFTAFGEIIQLELTVVILMSIYHLQFPVSHCVDVFRFQVPIGSVPD